MATPLWAQLINLLAALLLLLSFAMLAQRRVLSLIDLFAAQGLALACSTAIVAFATEQPHLYWSAGLTLVLKVALLPWILHRLIRQLDVKWDIEGLINIPLTMLIGIVLVIFSRSIWPRFRFRRSPSTITQGHARHCHRQHPAVIPDDDHAPQGGLAGDRLPDDGKRPVFRGDFSATYGMPLVVELGIALDVLVAMLILGVFFFQIRERFDSLDLKHLEKLKEGE